MPPSLVILDRAAVMAFFVGVIAPVGWLMLRSMRRKGYHRRAFHGWFVWVWMMGGTATGATCCVVNAIRNGIDPGPGWAAPFALGLLCGWAGGMIHGAVMLRHYVEPTDPPSDPDLP